jgi:hypothetical protein
MIRPDPQSSEEPPSSRVRRASHRQTVQQAIEALNPGGVEKSLANARSSRSPAVRPIEIRETFRVLS